MLTPLLFARIPGVRVERVWREDQTIHVDAATTRRVASCPVCGRRAKQVHSHYQRTLADLPCCGDPVMIHLDTRRFVCRVRQCQRKLFTERIPALVAPSARRTLRLQAHLERDGFDLGGAPGARHATAQQTSVSRRTLLQLVRAAPAPVMASVQVLGVDDWAQRKGKTYGTILVNLETHHVVDLLPDRTAETFATWLRHHPAIAIISRDRGGASADGARQGAPHAQHTAQRAPADRFHLLKNVTDSFERFLIRNHALLRHAAHVAGTSEQRQDADATIVVVAEEHVPAMVNREQREQQERRARRFARYEEVQRLRSQGYRIRTIARMAGMARGTVLRFLRGEGFPERVPRAPRQTLLTPFAPYLRERWADGCHNATQLWHELRQRGFTGGYSIVTAYLHAWREPRLLPRERRCPGVCPSVPVAPTPSPRQTMWLLLRRVETLTPDERIYLVQLHRLCPEVMLAQALVEEFATLVRARDVTGLYVWLARVEEGGVAELRGIARRMWGDRPAVEAAVATEWSNGQVEGQVNRLKMLKRAMYGRATHLAV